MILSCRSHHCHWQSAQGDWLDCVPARPDTHRQTTDKLAFTVLVWAITRQLRDAHAVNMQLNERAPTHAPGRPFTFMNA